MQFTVSQQAWIISQHLASPLVQVMQTPSLVISHLHMPIMRLQQKTVTPLSMQQQLHMPPASIVHRFCTMLHDVLSSHEQVIFMPSLHFSILRVQRGTISQLVLGDTPGGVPTPGTLQTPTPGIPTVDRSIIIELAMSGTPFRD